MWKKRAGSSGVESLADTTSLISLGSRLFFTRTNTSFKIPGSITIYFLFPLSALQGVSRRLPLAASFLNIQGRVYHHIFDLNYSESVNDCAPYIDYGAERLW